MIKKLVSLNLAQSSEDQDNVFYARVSRSLALLGAGALAPFAVMDFIIGKPVLGFIILVVAICQISIFFLMKNPANGFVGAHILAVFHTTAAVLGCLVLGITASFWMFPTTVANYYILPKRSAIIYNAASLLLTLPMVTNYPEMGIRYLVALALVNIFGFVFSWHTWEQKSALRELLLKDILTGAGNRRALEEEILQVRSMAERHQTPSTLLLLDLDHFKQINDTYGHGVGDKVLCDVVRLVKARLRVNDRLFRYGGEEFVIVARNTDLEGGRVLAEDIRQTIAGTDFETIGKLTASIGIASLQAPEPDDDWFRRADRAMYRAKTAGRNIIAY